MTTPFAVRPIAMLAAMALFALGPSARAAPPPQDSEDWKIMHPYQQWVTSQHDLLGRWCCDIGDGRPVEARISEDHWEVHVTKEHFPDEPERWLAVPEEKVTRGLNPMGTPILWLYQGRVQCFAPPDGA